MCCIDVWVIDQACGQDGWILAKFFVCMFMDRNEVEVHKHTKKERGQYPAIVTEQAWSIKDLFITALDSVHLARLANCVTLMIWRPSYSSYLFIQDFSRVTGKQEAPSGLASQQLSRLPSDEHICLSPPWNEEDDGLVRVGALFN